MNKRTLCACVAGIFTLSINPMALSETLPDRLERPASQTDRVTSKLFTDLVVVNGKGIGVGADGTVLTITSEGEHLQGEVPVDLLLTAVDFVNEKLGWAVGHDGAVLMTKDGGQSWKKQLDGIVIGELMRASAEQKVERLERAAEENPRTPSSSLRTSKLVWSMARHCL